MTTDGSLPPGEKPLEAIQRACRMILVEAGLTTVQADRIRTHIGEVCAIAACGADWKTAKADGKVPAGQHWPQFWSECNKRKKAEGM